MYPYLRWIGVLLRRPRPMRPLDECGLRFHVWPGDLDFFGHMNNGRYLTLMDLGRWQIMARLGLIPVMRRNGWISVLGGAAIRFLRPMRPFQRFELASRIMGWDEKWFYIEQIFREGATVFATATVRGLFRAPGQSVLSSEILRIVGHADPSPLVPAHVLQAFAEPGAAREPV